MLTALVRCRTSASAGNIVTSYRLSTQHGPPISMPPMCRHLLKPLTLLLHHHLHHYLRPRKTILLHIRLQTHLPHLNQTMRTQLRYLPHLNQVKKAPLPHLSQHLMKAHLQLIRTWLRVTLRPQEMKQRPVQPPHRMTSRHWDGSSLPPPLPHCVTPSPGLTRAASVSSPSPTRAAHTRAAPTASASRSLGAAPTPRRPGTTSPAAGATALTPAPCTTTPAWSASLWAARRQINCVSSHLCQMGSFTGDAQGKENMFLLYIMYHYSCCLTSFLLILEV